MQRLRVDSDIRSMSEFRTGIASFLKQVHDTKRPIVITKHGKGAAVLLDVGEYETMQEKLELLKDIQIYNVGLLESSPKIGRIVPEIKRHEIRELIHGNFRHPSYRC